MKTFLRMLVIPILLTSVIFWIFVTIVNQYVNIFKDWIFVYFVDNSEISWFIYMIIFILCYMTIDIFLPK